MFNRQLLRWQLSFFGIAWILSGTAAHAADSPIDFNRDIRPILSNRCLKCHGPDEKERQAGLRVDSRDGAFAKLESGKVAVVVGKPDESELIRRVTSADDSERMPPVGHGKPLDAREVELLRAWIRQGAKFAKHWSYERPARPAVPAIENRKSKIKNQKSDRRLYPGASRTRRTQAVAGSGSECVGSASGSRSDRVAADGCGG